MSPEEARELAASLLADSLPRRWRHTQGVAAQAARLRPFLDEPQGRDLVVAAWLHDIGYAPQLVVTGFHPVDGARHLRRLGVAGPVVQLVAHHSTAAWEACARGMKDALGGFDPPNARTADALLWSDMTTGPDGKAVDVEARLLDIRSRYAKDSPVIRGLDAAQGHVRAACERVSGWSGLHPM